MKTIPKKQRCSHFETSWLPELQYFHDVFKHGDTGGYKIIPEEGDEFIYFPKADKIQRTKDNEWFSNGLDFIKRNLIP